MRVVLPLLVVAVCLSPAMGSEHCVQPYAWIPASSPAGVTTSLDILCGDPLIIEDLDVRIEITHTWMGDVSATLSKQGGPSAVVFDRIGRADTGFGCSGDDMDAILSDEADKPVEEECEQAVPTIEGTFIPGDPPGPLMANFDGLELCGTWELFVEDCCGGDTGTIDRWCLLANSDDGGDGGTGVPAATGVGAILTVLLLLGTSVYFLRRRS